MTVEKRYQVFISTTYPDMQSARQALMLPLLDLGMAPMSMDLHSAETNNLMPVVQRMIDDCDYFVILLGGRYGTLSPLGLSYTHREYIFAATKRKPIVTFIHDQPFSLPAEAREDSREGQVRRDDFARLLENKTLAFRWRDERELSEQVAKVMPDVMRQHPAAGIEVLFDDREKERVGVKFSDAELIGIPHRVLVAERGLDNGVLEYKSRRDGDTEEVPADDIVDFLKKKLGL